MFKAVLSVRDTLALGLLTRVSPAVLPTASASCLPYGHSEEYRNTPENTTKKHTSCLF